MTFTSLELAQKVGGVLVGSEHIVVIGIEQVDIAGPQHVTYVRDDSFLARWQTSKAGVALFSKNINFDPASLASIPGLERAVIKVPDADLALNVLLDSFAPPRERSPAGIHPSAVVHPSAILGQDVSIGACCFVGAEVKIGDRTVLHPSVTIQSHTVIGPDCEFWPGVVIRDHCALGKRVILHPNVVIGGDGFGYRPSIDPAKPGLVKIPHIGNVVIEDDVEIGAGTCVDRAKFSSTYIGRGTKIDNLCQIGHNCRIGRFCIIAGQTGLAGTVTLGDGVMLGGGVSVKEHVVMGPGAKLAARSAVMDNVPAGAYWGGYPARDGRDALKEYAGMRRLPELVKLLKKTKGA